jgi:hypothetical protein
MILIVSMINIEDVNVEVINRSDVCNVYGMCFSQQKPHKLAAFMPLQLQAALGIVRKNSCALPQYIDVLPILNTPNFAHPYTNNEIPQETPFSNTEKYLSNRTTPNTLHSEVLSHTKVDTKETSSSTKASKIRTAGSHSLVPSTSSDSRITYVKNELKQARPRMNKGQKEKQSLSDSVASEINSCDGSDHHAGSKAHTKVTVTAPRTSVSKDSASRALPSRVEGKQKLTVYTLLS